MATSRMSYQFPPPAEAYRRDARVLTRRGARAFLRAAGWQERVIDLLLAGPVPPLIRCGADAIKVVDLHEVP